jgi:hypothetical protein
MYTFRIVNSSLISKKPVSNGLEVTRARRAASPTSDSSSSSSTSENPRQDSYDFVLPSTLNNNKKATEKKSTDLTPPALLSFSASAATLNEDDEDDDTSSSIFSKKNATQSALNHLKTMDDIARGDDTPRTRTTWNKYSDNKVVPIEYDDESYSQSQVSSVDDVTVDKTSPLPSTHIDFIEDL